MQIQKGILILMVASKLRPRLPENYIYGPSHHGFQTVLGMGKRFLVLMDPPVCLVRILRTKKNKTSCDLKNPIVL